MEVYMNRTYGDVTKTGAFLTVSATSKSSGSPIFFAHLGFNIIQLRVQSVQIYLVVLPCHGSLFDIALEAMSSAKYFAAKWRTCSTQLIKGVSKRSYYLENNEGLLN
jgi:hypothetical protein